MIILDREKVVERIIEQMEVDIERYYLTVYLLIGLMDYLEGNKGIGFHLVSCSPKMETSRNPRGMPPSDPKPDAVLQDTRNERGLLIEVKTSYPRSDAIMRMKLQEDIDQLQRFDRDLTKWKHIDGPMDEYCIIHLPYHERTSIEAMRLLVSLVESGEVVFVHPFSIWYWAMDRSMRQRDILKLYGSGFNEDVGWTLGSHLREREIIEIDMDNLYNSYDKQRHVFGREPPANCVYTILQIYNIMGAELRKGKDERIRCTVKEVMELADKYLPAWIPDDGKSTQLRVGWVKKSLKTLAEIKMAKLLSDGETYEWAEPGNVKDFRKVIIKKLAEKEAKKDKHGSLASSDSSVEISNLDQYL